MSNLSLVCKTYSFCLFHVYCLRQIQDYFSKATSSVKFMIRDYINFLLCKMHDASTTFEKRALFMIYFETILIIDR